MPHSQKNPNGKGKKKLTADDKERWGEAGRPKQPSEGMMAMCYRLNPREETDGIYAKIIYQWVNGFMEPSEIWM